MDAPAIAVSNDGKRIAVAWMDKRSGGNNRDVYWTIGSSGKFAPEAPVHDTTQGLQGHPSLVFDSAGTAWCAWEDAREGPNAPRIYAVSSKASANFRVSAPAEGKAAFPSLAAARRAVGVAYEAGGSIHFRLITPEK